MMGYYPDWEFESDEIDVTDLPARRWPHLGGCAVYRLYNASDSIIYAGLSDAPYLRFQDHKPRVWWPEVRRKTIVWYYTRTEAESVETVIILTQQPPYNTRRDKPMPIMCGTSTRDWVHMVPESALYSNPGRIHTIVERDRVHVGVAQRDTGKCTAIFVAPHWYERGCYALGELPLKETQVGAILVPPDWFKCAKAVLGEPVPEFVPVPEKKTGEK